MNYIHCVKIFIWNYKKEAVSKSAGADLETAILNGKNIILASGLPGIYSPQTAGEIIAETALRAVGRGDAP